MSVDTILSIFIVIFGALIGSFLNVVIYRVPKNLSVIRPRSACPKCHSLIKWYQNIPVLSYVIQKGQCASCEFKIPIQYPLVELLCALFAFLLLPERFDSRSMMDFVYFYSVACIFLAHFIIDIKHHLLPDKINFYLLLITIPFVGINYPILHWLLGGLIGFFGPYLVTLLFYKLKGQIGLGGGDIKLFGILGLLLGPIGVMNNIFLSCFLGSIIGIGLIVSKKLDRNSPLAFGPYIIIAASVQIFFPWVLKFLSPFVIV